MMSQPAQPLGAYASASDALAAVQAGLSFLARPDAASLPGGVLADCLRGLETAWTIRLNADGTKTFTSPDRKRVLHSHGPPEATLT